MMFHRFRDICSHLYSLDTCQSTWADFDSPVQIVKLLVPICCVRAYTRTADNHRRSPPPPPDPPPLQTKVTIVGKNEMYHKENLIAPYLFGSQTPPPPANVRLVLAGMASCGVATCTLRMLKLGRGV